MQLPTQEQFVKDCLAKYRWEPIPSDQQWEAAHYPLPACSGEDDTVMLWSADHTVQGLLQSVEFDHQCFHGYWNGHDTDLLTLHYPEYLPLFAQLKSRFNSRKGKKSAAINKANGTGIFAPGMQSAGGKIGSKKSAVTNQTNGTGVFAPGMQSAGGKKSAELKLGIHAPGMLGVGGKIGVKITNAQRWQCLVTGHISNPGALSKYQRARGIDTKLRVKLL